MNNIVDQQLLGFKAKVDEIVKQLHRLTEEIGHRELAETVSDLRNRINEPFMFVIVGEVKAGKSSFINALLDTGREICKVAASPMTDKIQQIVYGPNEETVLINPYLVRIHQPVDILKDIALVDTPGTNTIIDHHQEITERFIPASDLIIFVFEAKNPYRQSAWEFFDYIQTDWRKKIIFVLQQKDLLNEADLNVNTEGVSNHAEKKGVQQPKVFAVSAKDELEGRKDMSGFIDVRNYIKDHITGGRAPFLKISNNIHTATTINIRIGQGLKDRRDQFSADIIFRDDIRNTLHDQSKRSEKEVDMLTENLLASYDAITAQKGRELSRGLSIPSLFKRSFKSLFSKKESAKEWLEGLAKELEGRLNTELRDKLDDGVKDLATSIQQMAQMIDLKIRNSKTILSNDHEIFSAIAEKRERVLHDLQEAFSGFLKRSENFTDEELFPDKNAISPNIATGSGIAVVGIILAAVTNGMVFDITGGVLTTLGLLFAGVTAGLKRRKIIKGYDEEISRGRSQMEEEITSKLKAYIAHIREKIDGNFDTFDAHLELEKNQLEKLESEQRTIVQELEELEAGMKIILTKQSDS